MRGAAPLSSRPYGAATRGPSVPVCTDGGGAPTGEFPREFRVVFA
jgi:hypothetical protein